LITADQTERYPGLRATTVCGAFQAAAAARGATPALRTIEDGVVHSWNDYAARVRELAGGLAGLGLGKGATIATMLTNCPEFYFVDMAAIHLGAVGCGIYTTSPVEDVCHRLENADARIIATQQAFLPIIREAARRSGQIDAIIVVDGEADGCLTLDDVAARAPVDFDFESTWRAVQPEDLLTIIYTSGTTGPPKGAQWTHANAIAELRAWSQIHPLPTRCISYLPFAHAGERMLGHYMPLAHGATITCCEDRTQLVAHIIDVHPNFLVSVPTLWVKLMTTIRSSIECVEDEHVRATLRRTIELGEQRVRMAQLGRNVPEDLIAEHESGLPLLRETVLSKFGLDNVEVAIIGSAPAPADVLYFFHAAGVPLIEAYGATELSFCTTVAPSIQEFRLGTVGPPLPGLEVRIADDGEILVRGATVMHSYRKQPDATAATISPDGWLATGDVGTLDEAGHLVITDRKKELIVSLSGKNMSPAHIQGAVKGESSLIAHCIAVGDGRSYVVGLLALDPAEVGLFASKLGIDAPPVDRAFDVPEIKAEIEAAVERGNARLSRPEQLKKFAVVPDEWLVDSEELTPTGKPKRRNIEKCYAATIDALYR
jgi:long-subunit acyl-CoA synthetase (AMP-forming)